MDGWMGLIRRESSVIGSAGNEVPVLDCFNFLLYREMIDYSELIEEKGLK